MFIFSFTGAVFCMALILGIVALMSFFNWEGMTFKASDTLSSRLKFVLAILTLMECCVCIFSFEPCWGFDKDLFCTFFPWGYSLAVGLILLISVTYAFKHGWRQWNFFMGILFALIEYSAAFALGSFVHWLLIIG